MLVCLHLSNSGFLDFSILACFPCVLRWVEQGARTWGKEVKISVRKELRSLCNHEREPTGLAGCRRSAREAQLVIQGGARVLSRGGRRHCGATDGDWSFKLWGNLCWEEHEMSPSLSTGWAYDKHLLGENFPNSLYPVQKKKMGIKEI